MKQFLILATTALLIACGGAKVTSSSYASIADKATKTERDQYVFQMKKKAGEYFEVVEVKLLNEEKGNGRISSFSGYGYRWRKISVGCKRPLRICRCGQQA